MKKDFLFFDGAFGTYFRKLSDSTESCELANVTSPDIVKRIHLEYINAGANAITTNTFCANSTVFPNKSELAEVIRRGFEIAEDAASESGAAVFADIGGISSIENSADITAAYIESVSHFIAAGADKFIFETLDEFEPLFPVIEFIRERVPNAVIAVSFAVSQDGYTQTGKYYKHLISAASASGADIVGLNCICGPSNLYKLIHELDTSGKKIIAMPNSSYPIKVNNRFEYCDNPEYFADRLADIASAGAYALGGCCGTTPEHIRLAVKKISALPELTSENQEINSSELPRSEPSHFESSLEAGKFVIAVELDSPADTDSSYIIDASSALHAAGADAITIADSPLARAKADSIMIAAKVKRDIGIDTIPHIACRGRSRITIKSSLLAANIENVKNILIVTGDPAEHTTPTGGNSKAEKILFSLNSFNAISYIDSMNSEVFAKSPFYICGALNLNAANFGFELERAKKKISSGARCFLTQALFTEKSIENLKLAKASLDAKILAGIMPVASYKNALFLNNEVPGITIPKDLIASLEGKTPEETAEISYSFCKNIIDRIDGFCDGIYFNTPLKKTKTVLKLIKYIKEIHK